MDQHPLNPNGLRPLQLLLIGQREEDYFIIQDLLRAHGALITANLDQASGFEEAQTMLARKPYDLVLFQYESSERDTLEILRDLRQRKQTVPCLLLTEHADEATLAQIIQAGICECVSRAEMNQASLLRAIRSAVSLSRTERQCREQDDTLRKLHSAVEQSADMVVITDNAGIIEYVNPAFEKVTGYARAEATGQTPRILKSGEHGPDFYRDLWTTIQSGHVFRNVVVNRKKSGESYIAEKTVTPVLDADGKITHFISNDRDISDRRRLEAALFQAQKMEAVGRLAGGVAHDFNNLLTVITGYSELLLGQLPAPSPPRRMIRGDPHAPASGPPALTRQLLAFSRKQVLAAERARPQRHRRATSRRCSAA